MEPAAKPLGRRGMERTTRTPALDAGSGLRRDHELPDEEAQAVVRRSLTRIIGLIGLLLIVLVLTAGSSKHTPDLPYWLRPSDQFDLGLYGWTALVFVAGSALMLGPALRRPVVLAFYRDRLVAIGLIGRPRVMRYSAIADLAAATWDRETWLTITDDDGRRVRISCNQAQMSSDALISMINGFRHAAAFDSITPSGVSIDARYRMPGH